MAAFALTLVSIACGERVRVMIENGAPALFEPGEELRVAEKAVLRDLGIAGAHLAGGKRLQNVSVGDDEARLVEDADQVLALRRIDAGLAADRAVDLGEKRRRDLHKAHATAQDARGKSGEVADHAAAEGDDEIAALESDLEKALAKWREIAEALRPFAGLQDDLAGETALGC